MAPVTLGLYHRWHRSRLSGAIDGLAPCKRDIDGTMAVSSDGTAQNMVKFYVFTFFLL